MIIELSPGLADLDRNGWLNYREAIKNCLLAHRQGWHILAISRRVGASLLASDIFDQPERSFLETEILARAANLIGHARSAKHTLFARAGFDDKAPTEDRHIAVDLRYLANMDNLMPARLLVEDVINDGKFIVQMADLVSQDLGYHGQLRVDLVNGGGGGMDRLYGDALNDVRPLLCVVDSDRKFPGDKLGQTARKCLNKGEKNLTGSVRLVIWPFRELENTVPVSFLFNVFANDGIVRSRISAHYRFIKNNPREIVDSVMPFVDMKNGVTLDQINKFPQGSKEAYLILSETCAHLGCDGVVGISNNLIPMFLRLIEIQPRHLAQLRLKVIRMPDFGSIAEVLMTVIAFGASLGRVPHRLNP
jgi:hypothetical protein